jgi:benzoate membrane transport protein
MTKPIFVAPVFNLGVFLSFTVPLLLVSLTGQYLPRMAVMHLAGYRVPSRAVLTGTGLASLIVACFGGISIVLAAITAALCTGKDAHVDTDSRYVAGIANGVLYLVGGCFAGTIALVFKAVPAALAGLALIGAIVSNLRVLADEATYIESSVITFLVTASGMSIGGLGSAFLGVVLGLAAHWMFRPWRISLKFKHDEALRTHDNQLTQENDIADQQNPGPSGARNPVCNTEPRP